ncbi:SDR family oxidoreductase [Caballeronia zhejiangensis]|uniref:SDR family oxidoreductase n=1 Tax=Caballeronia zhejiangensis TaxID=871203 RepID=UPI001EF6BEA6|nr:SDR family oxidoreductase [Caballeronia zhejiangensis]MCG7400303.1 SDR family oxidoreductase [Caballeronia zhejiangensis]
MVEHPSKVLVVGATGSIGRWVVSEALAEGYAVRALVRDISRAGKLPPEAEHVVGNLTRPETLVAAVEGIDAVVFTHGGDGEGLDAAEHVDYGGVRNVLEALGSRQARIALMTLVGVTNRASSYRACDWKRRAERLVRASGRPYTVVRPGWFDYNAADQLHLVARQGDTRWNNGPGDGVVSRRQIAQVLVRSLSSAAADHKTFELDSEHGPATTDFDTFFASLEADAPCALDAVHDSANMSLSQEPERVRRDLERLAGQF